MQKVIFASVTIVLLGLFIAASLLLLPAQQQVDFAVSQRGELSVGEYAQGKVRRNVSIPVSSAYNGTVVYAAKEGQAVARGELLFEIDDGTEERIEEIKRLIEQRRNESESVAVIAQKNSGRKKDNSSELALKALDSAISMAQEDCAEYVEYNQAVEDVIAINALEVMAVGGAGTQSTVKKGVDESEIQKMREQLDELNEKRMDLSVESVMDGVVVRSDVKQGTSLAKGETALVLGSSDIAVIAPLMPEQLETVMPGMEARVSAEGRTWQTSVSGIDGENAVITPPEGFTAREGDNVDVKILTTVEKDVVKLPVECVCCDEKGDYVMTGSGGRLEKRYVELGASDDFSVVIEGGLDEAVNCAYYPEQYSENTRY